MFIIHCEKITKKPTGKTEHIKMPYYHEKISDMSDTSHNLSSNTSTVVFNNFASKMKIQSYNFWKHNNDFQ
jgi:hypothetical protein